MVQQTLKKNVLLLGAGRMGGALLKGWSANLGKDYVLSVVDPTVKASEEDIHHHGDNQPVVSYYQSIADFAPCSEIDIVFLATKPQMVEKALVSLQAHVSADCLIISVAAGIATASIQKALDRNCATVRAMPNIGAMLGKSVTAAYRTAEVSEVQQRLAKELFEAVGEISWLDTESQLHAATAVCGSGPAYFFAITEAMISAAKDVGLDQNTSQRLVIDTLSAAAALLQDNPDPSALREMVTSPKGTTAAGLAVLSHDNSLEKLLAETINAAAQRSRELA